MTDEELLSYNAGSREHRIWVARQNAPTPPAALTMSAHEAAHWARKRQENRWAEERKKEKAAIAERHEWIRKDNERILRERAEQKRREAEALVGDQMVENVFRQYACSPTERERITKLVMNLTPQSIHDPSAVELKILAYRSEMQ